MELVNVLIPLLRNSRRCRSEFEDGRGHPFAAETGTFHTAEWPDADWTRPCLMKTFRCSSPYDQTFLLLGIFGPALEYGRMGGRS